MEETEILPDMSVNFKDFAVETRFVVCCCQLDQAGKIDYTFPKILTLPADNGVKMTHKKRFYSHSIFVLAFQP